MCYMIAMDSVGVRELRQNLSVYLVRVAAGESLEVTDHGYPVAVLCPIRSGEPVLDKLQREGRLIPATGDLLAAGRRQRTTRSMSRILLRERDGRRL